MSGLAIVGIHLDISVMALLGEVSRVTGTDWTTSRTGGGTGPNGRRRRRRPASTG